MMEGKEYVNPEGLAREDFGDSFKWGVSTSAYQTEGAWMTDGKGMSIWDQFTSRKKYLRRYCHGREACNFYELYESDLDLMRLLHIPNFRFSLSWPRITPAGTGQVNSKGLDFYDRLTDACLERHITPWITLYHWDLPYALEAKGGWTNRDIINWFSEYVEVCVKRLSDRIKHWMILNEPMVFTGAGYFLGIHAPGRRGLGNFLPAVHHAALCQAEGGRVIRSLTNEAEIGTTFSCSHIDAWRETDQDHAAAIRIDAILNRLFIEPALGLGYPEKDLTVLQKLEKYKLPADEERLKFNFDFIGIQNYTREVVRYSAFTPYLNATPVKPQKRGVASTVMNWEVYPQAIYHILKKFGSYEGIKKIIITENGAAFPDSPSIGIVHDPDRLSFIRDHLAQVRRAKQEGVPVEGYFVWSFLDNLEWSEGYYPRFGLVYVDFETQQRIVKSSGLWYRDFLTGSPRVNLKHLIERNASVRNNLADIFQG